MNVPNILVTLLDNHRETCDRVDVATRVPADGGPAEPVLVLTRAGFPPAVVEARRVARIEYNGLTPSPRPPAPPHAAEDAEVGKAEEIGRRLALKVAQGT